MVIYWVKWTSYSSLSCENSDIILQKKVCEQTHSNGIYNRLLLLSRMNNCIVVVQ